MNKRQVIEGWFCEQLSDEAAFAIHLFLEQFTLGFEETYYGQIRRHLDAITPDHSLPDGLSQKTDEHQGGAPWEDDLPF